MTGHTRVQTQKAGWNFRNSYKTLPRCFFSEVKAETCSSPQLVVFNEGLAKDIGLDASLFGGGETAMLLAGNCYPSGAEPLAQAYAGHQFGHFNILGDGRALLIGEQISPSLQRWDVQLKGSGRTPYSRNGDGRAALGPMLREYLVSEAMHGLGIPTTRSLSVVASGDFVFRERPLPGAVLARVARSHIRVGTVEYSDARCSQEDHEFFLKYLISRLGNEVLTQKVLEPNASLAECASQFLRSICAEQGSLIAQWQLVGFVHGVMNTDNMSLSCETIDYGPCAFLDIFNPATKFSSIDRGGRYAFGKQPEMGRWNLARLGEALLRRLLPSDAVVEIVKEALGIYEKQYEEHLLRGYARKLGFCDFASGDQDLIFSFLDILKSMELDYNWTFWCLGNLHAEGRWILETPAFESWLEQWKLRKWNRGVAEHAAQAVILGATPFVIPRNVHVENALASAVELGDLAPFTRLLNAVRSPFAASDEHRDLALPPPPPSTPYRTFCGT